MQRLLALALVVAALFLGVTIVARGWRPPLDLYPVQGVDVSAANGPIDWLAARADGVDFAYIRANDGVRRDRQFVQHWEALRSAGIRRGALLRFSLCQPAQDQADQFVATVPRTGSSLPAVIELMIDPACTATPPPPSVIEGLVAMIATVERHTGRRVVLKVGSDFEERYHPGSAIPRTLWGVRRFFEPAYLARPWRLWQASNLARVDGVPTRVNWSVVPR